MKIQSEISMQELVQVLKNLPESEWNELKENVDSNKKKAKENKTDDLVYNKEFVKMVKKSAKSKKSIVVNAENLWELIP